MKMMNASAIICIIKLCSLIALLRWSPTFVSAEIVHNSDESTLEDLLANYDSRILPTREGLPIQVALRTNIFDMAEQRTIHSHYTIELTVHSVWSDFRLAFNSSLLDDLRLVGNKIDLIWTPDISFEEKIGIASKVTTDNKYAIISSNGNILFSQRVILTMYCDMNFRRFPFDDQHCTLPILSYAYNDEHLQLSWISKNGSEKLGAVTFLGDMDRLHTMFQVEGYSFGKRKRRFDDLEAYDELTITFHFHRHLPYYLVRIYMPLILIVVMSFGAFWIDYRSTPARTIMATTIVLTVVTFIVSIQGSLPPTTSIRSVDIYSLSCFMFVFAALVEFAFVQTIDIQVKIIERRLRKRNSIELEETNYCGSNSRKRRSNSSIAPTLSITDSEIPEIKVHGIFGKLATSLYREHLKHREVYHVLDYYAKRLFPLTFIVLNVIYFAVYSSHA